MVTLQKNFKTDTAYSSIGDSAKTVLTMLLKDLFYKLTFSTAKNVKELRSKLLKIPLLVINQKLTI